MTPHEKKAQEIVEMFNSLKSLKDYGGMYLPVAKECAIKYVEGKIDSLELNRPANVMSSEFVDVNVYVYEEIENWKQVLTEIENL